MHNTEYVILGCQIKSAVDYCDREWPSNQYILDILRCSVSFATAKDMVRGIRKFQALIETSDSKLKGCIVEVARIKNMLTDIKNWQNLDDYHYADIKMNVIIKVGDYKMVAEIQFLLQFFLDAKKIGHSFYAFVRNEEVYQTIDNMMKCDNNSKLNQLKRAIATMNSKLLNHFVLYGTLDSIINSLAKDKKTSQCQYLLQLSKNWKSGTKLLKDAFSKLNIIVDIDNDVKSEEKHDTMYKSDNTHKSDKKEEELNAVDDSDISNFKFVKPLKTPQCDKGHDSVLFTSDDLIAEKKQYSGGYACDVCRNIFEVGIQAYHCSKCGWDLCQQCWVGQKMHFTPKIDNDKQVGLQVKISIDRGDTIAFKAIVAKLKELDVKVLNSVVANWKDEGSGATLVTLASMYNKTEMVKILVELGVKCTTHVL